MQQLGPREPGTRQVLIGFDAQNGTEWRRPSPRGDAEIRTYCQPVHLPFMPKGLLLWGATTDTLVHGVKVGNMSELEVSGYAPLPGQFFEQGKTFDELQRLADAGEIEMAIEARQHLDMHEASPGTQVSVALSGPVDKFCLWGTTYTTGVPHRKAVVEPMQQSDRFSGRIDEFTLGGLRTVLDVVAPDARIAAELLIGLSTSSRGY